MTNQASIPKIGFTCAYTPLAVIQAAGFAPYRILPLSEAPDQAGQWIHDNLCPHVKRILDRAMADDLPELAGLITVNSCDTMRRLADAWRQVRPGEPVFVLDLPTTPDARATDFFTRQIKNLADTLGHWQGKPVSDEALARAMRTYNALCENLDQVRRRRGATPSTGTSADRQRLYNTVAISTFETAIEEIRQFLDAAQEGEPDQEGVPVFLFGNVLPDPQALAMLESGGARIIDDDLCTSARAYASIDYDAQNDLYGAMAAALLNKPPCARTFDPARPYRLADHILDRAGASNARGVIGYTMKFCDPYLARLPMIQERLQQAGMPLLLLEGDLSLGSIGQQRTRIEAFIEMLR